MQLFDTTDIKSKHEILSSPVKEANKFGISNDLSFQEKIQIK